MSLTSLLFAIILIIAAAHEIRSRKKGKKGPLTNTYEAYRYGFVGFLKFFLIGMICVAGIILLGYLAVTNLQP